MFKKAFLLFCSIVLLSCNNGHIKSEKTVKPVVAPIIGDDFGRKVVGSYDQPKDTWMSKNPQYESAHFSGQDYASLERAQRNGDEGYMGLIDKKGNIVVSTKYNGIGYGFVEGCVVVQNSKGLYGMVNNKGSEIIPCIYDDVESPAFGLTRIQKNKLFGFADISSGKIIFKPQFKAAVQLTKKFISFMNEPLHGGVIDTKGKIILKPEYTNIATNFIGDYMEIQNIDGKSFKFYKSGKLVKN